MPPRRLRADYADAFTPPFFSRFADIYADVAEALFATPPLYAC